MSQAWSSKTRMWQLTVSEVSLARPPSSWHPKCSQHLKQEQKLLRAWVRSVRIQVSNYCCFSECFQSNHYLSCLLIFLLRFLREYSDQEMCLASQKSSRIEGMKLIKDAALDSPFCYDICDSKDAQVLCVESLWAPAINLLHCGYKPPEAPICFSLEA